jgi:hypothetical protein
VIVEGGFGWWCESNDVNQFSDTILRISGISSLDLNDMKENEWKYLNDNYSVNKCYEIIQEAIG